MIHSLQDPVQAAYGRLLGHCSECPNCLAVQESGANAGRYCQTSERLSAQYRQERRRTA